MSFGNIGDLFKKIGIIRYLEWPCAMAIVKVVRRDLHRRQALRVNFDTPSDDTVPRCVRSQHIRPPLDACSHEIISAQQPE